MEAVDIWRIRVDHAGPMTPVWLRTFLAGALANPALDADLLLMLADALDEAARECQRLGWKSMQRDLRLLADLPRSQAPGRVPNIACDFQ